MKPVGYVIGLKWEPQQLNGATAFLPLGFGNVPGGMYLEGRFSARRHKQGMILKFVSQKGKTKSSVPLTQEQANRIIMDGSGFKILSP